MKMGIWELITNLVKLAVYFFDPNRKAREERKKIWKDFKDLETQYRQALADGKPQLAAQLGKKLQDMREEYKFISVYEYGDKKGKK